ncbi:MAG: hypothetical protein KJ804_03265 [Proteobacteria bacterium]|nr:hypothetical protein [Pseudomonadota bacterium]MBU1057324.1 hypothetical protein [Pseudomonadota bacterium]
MAPLYGDVFDHAHIIMTGSEGEGGSARRERSEYVLVTPREKNPCSLSRIVSVAKL